MASSSTTILDCPFEIIHSIFQSLDLTDLRRMCLVCEALRTAAEPLIYSTIHWRWERSQTPPITLLLRSILSRPQLAAYIQILLLDGDTFHRTEYTGRPPKIPVAGAELDQPISFIERMKVPYGSIWIEELHRGTMDAFVAILLSQLSNLTCLRVESNFGKESRFVGMVLRSALCESVDRGLPTFQRLQDVTFSAGKGFVWRKKYTRNTTDILPFFYLPAVQRISAAWIDNPIKFMWPAKHAPTPSTLTSLYLTVIREAHLAHILSATTGLKTLHWQWYYPDTFIRDQFVMPIIDLDQIVKSMFHVRDTLTDLTISARCDSDGVPPLTITGSLNAIVNFNALKRFEVPTLFLIGFSPAAAPRLEHVIPRNIEFLTITDDLIFEEENEMDDFTLLSAIRSWLKDWRAPTPYLRGISLLLRDTDEEWGPAMRSELRELCAGAGVGLEITKLLHDLG
jgi:hypothetical protein